MEDKINSKLDALAIDIKADLHTLRTEFEIAVKNDRELVRGLDKLEIALQMQEKRIDRLEDRLIHLIQAVGEQNLTGQLNEERSLSRGRSEMIAVLQKEIINEKAYRIELAAALETLKHAVASLSPPTLQRKVLNMSFTNIAGNVNQTNSDFNSPVQTVNMTGGDGDVVAGDMNQSTIDTLKKDKDKHA